MTFLVIYHASYIYSSYKYILIDFGSQFHLNLFCTPLSRADTGFEDIGVGRYYPGKNDKQKKILGGGVKRDSVHLSMQEVNLGWWCVSYYVLLNPPVTFNLSNISVVLISGHLDMVCV